MATTPLTITLTERRTVNVDEQEIGYALLYIAWKRAGKPDDAGCDWTTDGDRTCIAFNSARVVSEDPQVVALMNAGNILVNGKVLTVEPPDEGCLGAEGTATHELGCRSSAVKA